jgi:hypothetical protein
MYYVDPPDCRSSLKRLTVLLERRWRLHQVSGILQEVALAIAGFSVAQVAEDNIQQQEVSRRRDMKVRPSTVVRSCMSTRQSL